MTHQQTVFTDARHAGVEVVLGGTRHILPPLSVAAIEAYEERIAQAGGKPDTRLAIDLLHCALQSNYPELTREQVAEGIDLVGLAAVFGKLMSVSGFTVQGFARAQSAG